MSDSEGRADDMSAISTPPDEGTASVSPATATLLGLTASVWHPRVLLVDGDPVCRRAVQDLLEQLVLTVDVAADGPEAVGMSAGWPYVAVFMDCGAPGFDGNSVAREIRRQGNLSRNALVVAVSARARRVSVASGMDHHIEKPVQLEPLTADCRRLGLLPAIEHAQGELRERGLPARPAGSDTAELPLVELPPGAAPEMGSDHIAALVRRALPVLPELWRAANRGDLAVLAGIASELGGRAARAGAVRLAGRCEAMVRACEDRHGPPPGALEPPLRRALMQTAEAVTGRLSSGGPERPLAAVPTPEAMVVSAEPGTISSAEATEVLAAQPRPLEPSVLTVAVADDDPFARSAIEAMIERSEGLQLVGSAADADEIVELVLTRRPDVVVLDYLMAGGGGPLAARRILECAGQTRIVALTASDAPEAFLAMLKAGASGRVVKGGSAGELARIIRRAAERPSAVASA